MTNSFSLFKSSADLISKIYPIKEAETISFLLLNSIFSVSKTEILSQKEIDFDSNAGIYQSLLNRLLNHEPIQYVLGETEFFGLPFFVNKNVLIPRPETEELVKLILQENPSAMVIADIGTGSGCIPIALKKHLPNATIYGIDISEDALEVAIENARRNDVKITFVQGDLLSSTFHIPKADIIISNPPYITTTEKKMMRKNVLNFEPHLALFVSEENPLIFYKAIAEKAMHSLSSNGKFYVEINENFCESTSQVFIDAGFFEIKIYKDFLGKNRIISGKKKT